ncbi:MAG TPA: ParB/RepB/Spo0J family partition protein [Alphaproteobacteria bacterium]|nr:ParB/RepB/Spo0J family partition protein [Alphaproteobacteria bacterium]
MIGPEKRLGRGLSALFADAQGEAPSSPVGSTPRQVPTASLRPGRYQPRRRFDAEQMAALVESVRSQGVLQPILVRPAADAPGTYEIVAGERRWRAAQEAQLHEVPIVLRELTDGDALEIALVENVQREDLTPLEEAEGYRRLIEEFHHTQEELAHVVGKSRSHVANTMRLLTLPESVKALIEQGEISAGHARALLNLPDPAAAAREVVKRGFNVRQTESLAQRIAKTGAAVAKAAAGKDADTRALEDSLSLKLGLKVSINPKGQKGEMVLRYSSLSQLDDVILRLTRDS